MQLIYRKINPSAKNLPKELRFDSLNLKDFIPVEQTDIQTLVELQMPDKRKEEKLKKLKVKYKHQPEIYEKFERGYNQADDYQPKTNEIISPCAKAIKYYARKYIKSCSPAKMIRNTKSLSK